MKKVEYIKKSEIMDALEKERNILLDLKMYGAEHIMVHRAINVIDELPTIFIEEESGV